MFESSTVGLHFGKLTEVPSESLPLAFYVSLHEQHNQSIRSCKNIVLRQRKRNLVIHCTAQPGPQPLPSELKPPPQPLPSEPKQAPWWRSWTLGALLSVGLPFFTNQMSSLKQITSELETKLQATENIVEQIQRNASEIEKRAEERLEAYRKHDGVPRRIMVYIETAADRIAKTACTVDNVIDLVQDIFLFESPDNEQARKLYRAEKDKKEKSMDVDKEDEDPKEKSMEVDKGLEDRTQKAMEDAKSESSEKINNTPSKI